MASSEVKQLFYQLGQAQRLKPQDPSDAKQVACLLLRYLHHCNGSPDPSLLNDVKALVAEWEHCKE